MLELVSNNIKTEAMAEKYTLNWHTFSDHPKFMFKDLYLCHFMTAKTTGSLIKLIPPPVGPADKLTQLFGRHTTPVLVPVQLHHRERPPQAGARPCPPLHGSRPQRQAQHREPFRRQSSGEERGQEESLCVFSTL